MKKRFLEGFRKFVAIFVLVQMVLVLFPAPAVYAGGGGTSGDDMLPPDKPSTKPEFYEPYNAPLPIEATSYSGANITNTNFTPPQVVNSDLYFDLKVTCNTTINANLINVNLGALLPIGLHRVVCRAVDFWGRYDYIEFTIEIYDGPPVIAVDEPEEYFVEIGTKFINPWTATVTDAVDGTKVPPVTISATKTITDKDGNVVDEVYTEREGEFTITYTAKDSEENPATEVTRTVHVVDEDPLFFTFTDPTPKDNHIQNYEKFTVEVRESRVVNGGSVFEIERCDLYIDGTELPREMFPPENFTGQEEYKHYSALVEITQDQGTTKEYEYTVACWNADKGTTSFTRKITIDLKAPDLSFVSPTPINGSIINESTFEVRVEGSEELDRCQVSLNNREIIPMTFDKTTGQWFSVLSGLSEGGYGYVVNCFDLAENSNNISRFLIVDFVNEPVVLTPVSSLVVSDFYAPVTEKDETAISSAIEKIEEDVLGEEGAVAETQAGNWWWIVALILAALLFANFHLAKRFSEMDIAKKILIVTPMVFGLVALVIHQSLIRGTEYSPWQDDIWLLIAVMVVAYYLFKGYTEKKEEKPKPSITKNSKNKKGKK